jgi:hypothetical protein
VSERTQRGLAETFYLKVTFFRCCSYPAESQIPRNHLYEPNSPFPKGPSAWCPSCYPSGLSPVSWPNSNEGSRQGVGHCLNGVYQHSALYCPSPTDSPRRAKTCHYHHFLQMRRQRSSCHRSSVQVDLHTQASLGHHHPHFQRYCRPPSWTPNDSDANTTPRIHHPWHMNIFFVSHLIPSL